jgi:hypothetical protein
MVSVLELKSIPNYKNPAASNFTVYQQRYLIQQSEADPKLLTRMRQLTMSVMYCALRTRRDVLFLASFLSSVKCPTHEDITAIERVIIYLYNTISKKQYFYRAGEIKLTLYSDASHNAFVDAKGQHCEIVYGDEFSAALDMSSSKEKIVTMSSCESEQIGYTTVGLKGIKTYEMLTELDTVVPLPMKMYSDNNAAVIIAQEEHVNKLGRTKYFNRLLFKINEGKAAGYYDPTWISTEEMDSDIGTKALMGSQFDLLSNRTFSRMHEYKLGEYIKSLDTPKRGGSKVDDNNNNQIQVPEESSIEATAKPKVSKVPVNDTQVSIKRGGADPSRTNLNDEDEEQS